MLKRLKNTPLTLIRKLSKEVPLMVFASMMDLSHTTKIPGAVSLDR